MATFRHSIFKEGENLCAQACTPHDAAKLQQAVVEFSTRAKDVYKDPTTNNAVKCRLRQLHEKVVLEVLGIDLTQFKTGLP